MAEKKGGLGRGIGALIPTSEVPGERPVDVFFPTGGSKGSPEAQAADLIAVPGARFGHLDINSIVPNPRQPRSVFEPEAFAELIHSIRELGVLQPIVVRPLPDQNGKRAYELIMGERRLRASKEVGLDKIPAVIRETADENMLRDALLENLHRSDLNPLEEASAYQQLLDDFGITQEELANRIGRSRPKITNTLRLLKLPADVQRKVAAGVLSAGHARAILAAPDTERMSALATKTINEGLSVRALEELVSTEKPAASKSAGKVTAGGRQDSLKEMAERLGDQLNTRVKIALGKKNGTIQIDFGSLADLNRILDEIGYKRD
ncbi:MAG: ParB/RepB/Spo0J family partition protein [Micrococcales bacterium]